jgi:RNase P subunit RPR2
MPAAEDRLMPCPKCNYWASDESHADILFRGDNRRAKITCRRCGFELRDLINPRAARRAWNAAATRR